MMVVVAAGFVVGFVDDGVIALHMNGLSMHWGVMVVVRRLRARKARPRSG
jgi:hypothetical protein